MPDVVLHNGEQIPFEDANLHITTHSVNYGTAIFEGIRAYYVEPEEQLYCFRLADHIDRMLRNLTLLRMEQPVGRQQLIEETLELLRTNHPETDTYIRPLVYYGEGGIGVAPIEQDEEYIVFTQPLGNYFGKDDDEPGLDLQVASWTRISDNQYPARGKIVGAYVNSALAKLDAHHDGYDEAILLTRQGTVSEGSGENLFIVRDGTLYTPPVTADILEGITRDSVIELARDEGFEVVEREIHRTELYIADEVFVVGTAAEVTPVLSIDRREIGDGSMGPITGKLRQSFFDVVKGRNPDYEDWLTAVY